jgi:hypothetical protein
LRRGFHHVDNPSVTQVLQSENDWICLDVRAELIHETFMSKGILNAQWRA